MCVKSLARIASRLACEYAGREARTTRGVGEVGETLAFRIAAKVGKIFVARPEGTRGPAKIEAERERDARGRREMREGGKRGKDADAQQCAQA